MTQRIHFRIPRMQTCTSFVGEERGECYEFSVNLCGNSPKKNHGCTLGLSYKVHKTQKILNIKYVFRLLKICRTLNFEIIQCMGGGDFTVV